MEATTLKKKAHGYMASVRNSISNRNQVPREKKESNSMPWSYGVPVHLTDKSFGTLKHWERIRKQNAQNFCLFLELARAKFLPESKWPVAWEERSMFALESDCSSELMDSALGHFWYFSVGSDLNAARLIRFQVQ